MLLTSYGNLIEVNKHNAHHIKGLLLSTESNSHLEFFNPWYYYEISKIYKYSSKYKYIIWNYIIFKTPLNYGLDSVLFFPTSTKQIADTRFSVQYARIAYKTFNVAAKSY